MREREQSILRGATDENSGSPWAGDYLRMTYDKGLLAGGVDELLRVSQEFSAFAEDVEDARQDDVQTRIALGAALQGMWKRSHDGTIEAPPHERGGNR